MTTVLVHNSTVLIAKQLELGLLTAPNVCFTGIEPVFQNSAQVCLGQMTDSYALITSKNVYILIKPTMMFYLRFFRSNLFLQHLVASYLCVLLYFRTFNVCKNGFGTRNYFGL